MAKEQPKYIYPYLLSTIELQQNINYWTVHRNMPVQTTRLKELKDELLRRMIVGGRKDPPLWINRRVLSSTPLKTTEKSDIS